MERLIQLTADGSHTIAVPAMQVSYHSLHGALQESQHVFIQAGLQHVLQTQQPTQLHILEMGFGTGLNALLTLQQATTLQQPVVYHSIEQYPLPAEQALQLNYTALPGLQQLKDAFASMHTQAWGKAVALSPYFTLFKQAGDITTLQGPPAFHLLYYDAFAPAAQPELWTAEQFNRLLQVLLPGGIMVTYCSKSYVRKNMLAAGFVVEKIGGPWGKREMLRAMKPLQ